MEDRPMGLFDFLKMPDINEELEKYKSCTQKLTEGDCKRLEVLIKKIESEGGDTRVLQYMKEKGRKLEQEGIEQT